MPTRCARPRWRRRCRREKMKSLVADGNGARLRRPGRNRRRRADSLADRGVPRVVDSRPAAQHDRHAQGRAARRNGSDASRERQGRRRRAARARERARAGGQGCARRQGHRRRTPVPHRPAPRRRRAVQLRPPHERGWTWRCDSQVQDEGAGYPFCLRSSSSRFCSSASFFLSSGLPVAGFRP